LKASSSRCADRLFGLPGEAAYALAMRSQEECFEIPDGFVRDKLEELADPAAVAARAAAAGVESKYREVHRRDDNDSEKEDCSPDAVE
jgi:hypothetical protein